LNEVGVPLRQAKNLAERWGCKGDSGSHCRILEGYRGVLRRKGTNIGKAEKPLGIGLRYPGQSGQDGQARTQEHQGLLLVPLSSPPFP